MGRGQGTNRLARPVLVIAPRPPPCHVLQRRQEVTLGSVTPRVGGDQVLQVVIGNSGPGKEMVNGDRALEQTAAVETIALLQIHQRSADACERRAFLPE